MARVSKQTRTNQRKNLLVASFALLIVISVIAIAMWWSFQKKSSIDASNLCPAGGPIGHYVVLIDTTDPLNTAQKAAIDLKLTQLIEQETPAGYLISVFVLGDNFQTDVKPLIELCNPGDEQGHSELTENIKQIKRRYADRFLEPLRIQTTKLLNSNPASNSPILEMLQMVSLNSIERHAVSGPRKLVVFSDFLQNSKSLSMYREVPNYVAFSELDYARKTKISYRGVQVEAWMLQNSSNQKQSRLIEFWKEYFLKNDALAVNFDLLPG